MLTTNIKPEKVGVDQYIIRVNDNALTRLVYKYGVVNIKIGPPMKPGTEAQNRLFHKLLTEWRKTYCHSAPKEFCESLEKFKIWVKMQHGPCYCLNMDGQVIKIPKSWADYSVGERRDCIDGVKHDIIESGALSESKILQEIFNELESIK